MLFYHGCNSATTDLLLLSILSPDARPSHMHWRGPSPGAKLNSLMHFTTCAHAQMFMHHHPSVASSLPIQESIAFVPQPHIIPAHVSFPRHPSNACLKVWTSVKAVGMMPPQLTTTRDHPNPLSLKSPRHQQQRQMGPGTSKSEGAARVKCEGAQKGTDTQASAHPLSSLSFPRFQWPTQHPFTSTLHPAPQRRNIPSKAGPAAGEHACVPATAAARYPSPPPSCPYLQRV